MRFRSFLLNKSSVDATTIHNIIGTAIVIILVLSNMNALELNDVCKYFGQVHAVDKLSV